MDTYCTENLPPVPFKTRVSARARRIRLRFSVHSGLELVLPEGTPALHARQMLERCQPWICRQIRESLALCDQKTRLAYWQTLIAGTPRLEGTLFLPYTGEYFRMVRGTDPLTESCIRLPEDDSAALKKMQRWLCTHARKCLEPVLLEHAAAYGCTVRLVRVGLTRGRWGSCSIRKRTVQKDDAQGYISLSACLLFLPPILVQHVLTHELCHLEYMCHDARFYALLQRRDPDWQAHSLALKQSMTAIPLWV